MKRFLSLAIGAAVVAAGAVAAPAAVAAPSDDIREIALIGDLPYGAADIEKFPGWIADINADADVDLVIHVGDTKAGGDRCDDEFYTNMAASLNTFRAPLVYTPGDNEWTDCHRESNGSYNPLDRLRKVMDTHYPQLGRTLGQKKMKVEWQPAQRENVQFHSHGVTFATVHVVGSNNGARAWSGLGKSTETLHQRVERIMRMCHAIQWMQRAFDAAEARGDRAVAIALHADMFTPGYSPSDKYNSEFRGFVQALAAEAKAFGKPVYLIDGDSHELTIDTPMVDMTEYMEYYGITEPVTNLTRVTVDGSSNAGKGWLKATIHTDGDDILTFEQVPFTQ